MAQSQPHALLVVAHPGHELRVHSWLETARPQVWILTDGSGRSQHSRIDSTTNVLKATGATRGPVYGQMTDVSLYNAVLSFEYRKFTDIVDQLVDALMRDDIDCVAGDAEEGYNPAHDVCRFVINAAIQMVKRRASKQIVNYDFTLAGEPVPLYSMSPQLNDVLLHLDEHAFQRKLLAAQNYPELQAEVEAALKGPGHETFRDYPHLVARARSMFGVAEVADFRVEHLRAVDAPSASTNSFNSTAPFYESYGEKQVREGHYTRVLRFKQHMLPLAHALDAHVESNS
jgi:hypothetical protein